MRLKQVGEQLEQWWQRVRSEATLARSGAAAREGTCGSVRRSPAAMEARLPSRAAAQLAGNLRSAWPHENCCTSVRPRASGTPTLPPCVPQRRRLRRDELLERSRHTDATLELVAADGYFFQQRQRLLLGPAMLNPSVVLAFGVVASQTAALCLLVFLHRQRLLDVPYGSLTPLFLRSESDREVLSQRNRALRGSRIALSAEHWLRLAQLLRLHRAECRRMRLFFRYASEQVQRRDHLEAVLQRLLAQRAVDGDCPLERSVRHQLAEAQENLAWARRERDRAPSQRQVNAHLLGRQGAAEGDPLLPTYAARAGGDEHSRLLYLPPPLDMPPDYAP